MKKQALVGIDVSARSLDVALERGKAPRQDLVFENTAEGHRKLAKPVKVDARRLPDSIGTSCSHVRVQRLAMRLVERSRVTLRLIDSAKVLEVYAMDGQDGISYVLSFREKVILPQRVSAGKQAALPALSDRGFGIWSGLRNHEVLCPVTQPSDDLEVVVLIQVSEESLALRSWILSRLLLVSFFGTYPFP